MEALWPSRRRRWKVLRIVVTTCFFLLRTLRGSPEDSEGEWDDQLGRPDFRLLSRTGSVSSRKSLSALDVGLGEEDGSEEEPLSSLQSRKREEGVGQQLQASGHVYKLSTGMARGSGDYLVRGDSSYMLDKSPRWSNSDLESSAHSHSPSPHTLTNGLAASSTYRDTPASVRRMSLMEDHTPSLAPGLHLELTSCTQCPHCLHLLYDEVIMANWSESESDYKTRCPYCSSYVVATLTIVRKQRLPCSEKGSSDKERRDHSQSIAEEEEEEEIEGGGEGEGEGEGGREGEVEGGGGGEGEGEGEGGGEGEGEGEGESTDGDRERRERFRETGNWTMSLDRRTTVSPQREKEKERVSSSAHTPSENGGRGDHAPFTDPTHRRVRGVVTEGGREETDQPSGGQGSQGGQGDAGGCEGVMSVVSDKKPPLPPGVRESRRDHDKQQQQQQQQQQQTKSAGNLLSSEGVREVVRGEEGEEGESGEGVTQLSASARLYVAQMRSRGHKRASSAPIPYQPLSTSPSTSGDGDGRPPTVVIGGEGERSRTREPRTRTRMQERVEPEEVVPYLSPVVLRKELESLLSRDTSRHILSSEELVTQSPSVYWNLVWYFSRLQLPTYLPLLSLWRFTRSHRELRKQSVQMKVNLMWDKRFPNTQDPLYLMWLGKVPRVMQLPSSPGLTRSDSSSQLQSLVAKIQWGQLTPVLQTLLEDRQKTPPTPGEKPHPLKTPPTPGEKPHPHRSVYREMLFFKAAILGSINVDQFDREFRVAVQRLPRSLVSLLSPEDTPPCPRARHCRTNFGPLQVT